MTGGTYGPTPGPVVTGSYVCQLFDYWLASVVLSFVTSLVSVVGEIPFEMSLLFISFYPGSGTPAA